MKSNRSLLKAIEFHRISWNQQDLTQFHKFQHNFTKSNRIYWNPAVFVPFQCFSWQVLVFIQKAPLFMKTNKTGSIMRDLCWISCFCCFSLKSAVFMKSAMLFTEKQCFSSCKIIRFGVITKYRSFVYNERPINSSTITFATKVLKWKENTKQWLRMFNRRKSVSLPI